MTKLKSSSWVGKVQEPSQTNDWSVFSALGFFPLTHPTNFGKLHSTLLGMASEHSHEHHHHHHEPHEHSENCNHAKTDPHVFTRGDLLRHYQDLERIATFLPPEILDQELVVQMDALVGFLEHQLYHRYSNSECDHSHECDHEEDDHDHHEHHHHHDDIDPWEEVLKEDISLLGYRNRIKSSFVPLHPSVYDFKKYE